MNAIKQLDAKIGNLMREIDDFKKAYNNYVQGDSQNKIQMYKQIERKLNTLGHKSIGIEEILDTFLDIMIKRGICSADEVYDALEKKRDKKLGLVEIKENFTELQDGQFSEIKFRCFDLATNEVVFIEPAYMPIEIGSSGLPFDKEIRTLKPQSHMEVEMEFPSDYKGRIKEISGKKIKFIIECKSWKEMVKKDNTIENKIETKENIAPTPEKKDGPLEINETGEISKQV